MKKFRGRPSLAVGGSYVYAMYQVGHRITFVRQRFGSSQWVEYRRIKPPKLKWMTRMKLKNAPIS